MYGNNCNIIRSAFEKRSDYWKEVPNFNLNFNFKWQPFSKGLRFDQLSFTQKQMVNHFEYHAEVTTKDGLFKNMLSYAQSHKLNVFDYVPLTFTVDLDNDPKGSDLDKFVQCYNMLDVAQFNKIDKFEGEEYEKIFRLICAKISTLTFTKEKRASINMRGKLYPTHYAGQNLWILKPTGFNRGRGISVFDSIDKLRTLLKEYSEGVPEDFTVPVQINPIVSTPSISQAPPIMSQTEQISTHASVPQMNNDKSGNIDNGMVGGFSNINNLPCIIKTRTFVIQKYIERPLLIHGRKFDIRCWALIADDMKLYYFKEGYIRTSSSEFTMDKQTIEKKDIHLTNNAVQKFCEGYGKFEDGNQLSFPMFQVFF